MSINVSNKQLNQYTHENLNKNEIHLRSKKQISKVAKHERCHNLKLPRIQAWKRFTKIHAVGRKNNMKSKAIVAIGKPERQVRKSSHCGSKQQ